jgi:CheY-like chemotaxis protein/AraC-like DNA-binding protein
VLIVEDEPAAGRYLRSMIEHRRPEFSVIGIAGNGRAGLEAIRSRMPDLVITDVKMPVMDGIEFVTTLKKSYPGLPAIIVSGFQEFEYARRALDTGVVDYLLKPVDPIRLVEVLDRLASLLSAQEGERRSEALMRLVEGDSRGAAGSFTANELFWLAIARSGGLPSRFRLDQASEGRAVCDDGLFILPGRDSRERIYIGQKERLSHESFAAAVRADEMGSSFRTVLISGTISRADELGEAARNACLDLDRLLVAGLPQVHYGKVERSPEAPWDKVLADRIEFALREARVDLLEKAIRDMALVWRRNRTPLISIESQLRRILQFVLRKAPLADREFASDLEFHLEEALSSTCDFDGLSDSAWSLVSQASGARSIEANDLGVPAFFNCILRYVGNRYSEPLNLASLSETFRISSSYLSKLFRQHVGLSFGEFLSSMRIDAAKRLIRESPDMPLKDVAESVGFSDPFYFSRVFKAIAGLPPSGYSRSIIADAKGTR